jgi:DNA polymerase
MQACSPFLFRQISIVRPRVICALGAIAAKALLGPGTSITRIRGQVHAFGEIPVVATFHPAYLLRNPSAKKESWADLQLVKRLLAA